MALEQRISRRWMRQLVLPGLLATALAAPLALDASANDHEMHRVDVQHGNVQPVQAPRDRATDATDSDRMGNFEVQELMSRQSQTENQRSSVKKKSDDQKDSIIQKIK
jgi:hypothetical protein